MFSSLCCGVRASGLGVPLLLSGRSWRNSSKRCSNTPVRSSRYQNTGPSTRFKVAKSLSAFRFLPVDTSRLKMARIQAPNVRRSASCSYDSTHLARLLPGEAPNKLGGGGGRWASRLLPARVTAGDAGDTAAVAAAAAAVEDDEGDNGDFLWEGVVWPGDGEGAEARRLACAAWGACACAELFSAEAFAPRPLNTLPQNPGCCASAGVGVSASSSSLAPCLPLAGWPGL
mmetsp:Transcript_82844/g.165704  ORF Transcript_82844/g.165704 Transcript_82844/m.165704 type:complete len:229 (-) Transcript_82844:175-861(-)